MPSTQPVSTQDKWAPLRVHLYFSLYWYLIFTGLLDAGPDSLYGTSDSGSLVPESSCLDNIMTWLWVFFSSATRAVKAAAPDRGSRDSGWNPARAWDSQARGNTKGAGSASCSSKRKADL